MEWSSRTDGGSDGMLDHSLVVIDIGLVVGLIVVGQLSHGISPLAEPSATAEAATAFVVGWLVIAFAAGLYSTGRTNSPLRSARWTAICWFAASNLGFLIRGSPLVDGNVPWEFTVVMTGLGLLLFVPVHVAYATLHTDR